MEYIKPKQEGAITKDLIRTMQLDQSRLRFTRFNQLPDGTYQRDDSSTAYSSIMVEGKTSSIDCSFHSSFSLF